MTAPGATWLDYRLVERERMPLATSFGQEVRNAMEARAGHLAADGLARRRQRPGIVPQRDLLATLRCRELDAVAAGCPTRSGCPRPQPARRLPAPSAGASA
jgi:hypothetical protein